MGNNSNLKSWLKHIDVSANIVNTQGVPIGVKAQLPERVNSLTRR